MILFYGGWLTGQDVVTVGTLAAFVLYLQNLFEPIQQMSQLFNTIQAAGASLQKLYGLLDEQVEIDERPGAVDLPASGALEVDDVSFRYGTGPPCSSGCRSPCNPAGASRSSARPARGSPRSPS